MKKTVLILAVLVSGLSFAQQGKEGKEKFADRQEMRQERQEKRLEKMKEELGLSDQQTEQIKALHEEFRKERGEKREKMQKERAEIQKEREAKRKKMHEKMDQEMKKILTPEQFKKWKENAPKHDGKRPPRKRKMK